MNRLSFFLLPLAFCLGVSPVHAQYAYTVTDLGDLPGGTNFSRANGINASGQVVGDSQAATGQRAFGWNAGAMYQLPTDPAASVAFGINASGRIVGAYEFISGQWAGFYHIPTFSAVISIPDLGGSSSYAHAINDNWLIVGYSQITGNTAFHAYSYVEGSGASTDLGTLGGTNSVAQGVNLAGRVVGSSQIAGNSAIHAFSYLGGAMTDLGTLGGTTSIAYAINSTGIAVGEAQTSGAGFFHAFSHDGGAMTDLGTLGGDQSQARAINAGDVIVGHSQVTGNTATHAFIYDGGLMTDLNSLVNPLSGWVLESASGINDAGQIVGYGTLGGVTHAFLLTPAAVPEPATLAMIGVALGGAGAYWRKRRQDRRLAESEAADATPDE